MQLIRFVLNRTTRNYKVIKSYQYQLHWADDFLRRETSHDFHYSKSNSSKFIYVHHVGNGRPFCRHGFGKCNSSSVHLYVFMVRFCENFTEFLVMGCIVGMLSQVEIKFELFSLKKFACT